MDQELLNFYHQYQDELEKGFSEYISEGEWGSGEDRITITDDMFWEYVSQEHERAKSFGEGNL